MTIDRTPTPPGPFSKLSDAGRKTLANGITRTTVPASARVLERGQSVSGAYLVLDGQLRVFTIAPNGTEATLYLINPGETCVLSVNCAFNDLAYPAWVQAATATTIGVIPGAVYRQLFDSETTIRDLTVQALAMLVYRLMSELEQVHSSTHRQRLAHFILERASAGSVMVTQQQIAQHLGTTREVIARLMQELVTKRLVRTQRGSITVLDPAGLRRLREPGPLSTA